MRRYFDGEGIRAVVTRVLLSSEENDYTGLWHVRREDGDEEDLDEREFNAAKEDFARFTLKEGLLKKEEKDSLLGRHAILVDIDSKDDDITSFPRVPLDSSLWTEVHFAKLKSDNVHWDSCTSCNDFIGARVVKDFLGYGNRVGTVVAYLSGEFSSKDCGLPVWHILYEAKGDDQQCDEEDLTEVLIYFVRKLMFRLTGIVLLVRVGPLHEGLFGYVCIIII